MKCYKLITQRQWLELQHQAPENPLAKHSFMDFPQTRLQVSGFKPVRFDYRAALDEITRYCVNNPEQCQQLYATLEQLGLYQGTNTYGRDNAKVIQAFKDAIDTERAILLEKPIELDSGLLPPQTQFLRLPTNTIPRKLTTEEIRERELRYYDEENWIELSVDNLPNQPFTLFRSSSQKVIYQGKLDNKGHAYVKLDADIKLVDVLFDKQQTYRPWYYDIPLQLIGGARDATQNSLDLVGEFVQQKTKLARADDYFSPLQVLLGFFTRDAGEDLRDVLKKQNRTIHANLDQFANPITLPDVDAPDTISGALTRGITQFLVGYITAYRVIKPIT